MAAFHLRHLRAPGGYKEPNGFDVVPEGGRLNAYEVGFAPASNSSRRIGVWPRAAASDRIVPKSPDGSFGSAPSDSSRRTSMVLPCLTALYNSVCSIQAVS
jgi:hypothetical protein